MLSDTVPFITYDTNVQQKNISVKRNAGTLFRNYFDEALNINSVNNTETYSDEQTLIEDKKLYESRKDLSELSEIEFGSIEWNQWKIDHNDNFFPPLNAPSQVRQAWRETKESIPENDKDAQKRFRRQTLNLYFEMHFPSLSNIPSYLKFNNPADYESLLNFDMYRIHSLIDTVPLNEKNQYIKDMNFDQSIIDKLHKLLLGL